MQPFTNPFTDRREAGRELAQRLLAYKGDPSVLVLAVSRGGALVADGIAEVIEAPLDMLCARSLGIPGYEEVSMGTVARGVYRSNREAIESGAISMQAFLDAASALQEKLNRLETFYRFGRAAPVVTGRTAILVDEGLTSESMLPAAVDAVQRHGAAEAIVAVPVAVAKAYEALNDQLRTVVCLYGIDAASGLEAWYADSTDVDDQSVRDVMHQAAERLALASGQEAR